MNRFSRLLPCEGRVTASTPRTIQGLVSLFVYSTPALSTHTHTHTMGFLEARGFGGGLGFFAFFGGPREFASSSWLS